MRQASVVKDLLRYLANKYYARLEGSGVIRYSRKDWERLKEARRLVDELQQSQDDERKQ